MVRVIFDGGRMARVVVRIGVGGRGGCMVVRGWMVVDGSGRGFWI